MSHCRDNPGPLACSQSGEGAGQSEPLLRFLRQSHIFASTVREILEVGLLREVSPEPLSFSQFHVLKMMSMDGHHQAREVADFLGVTPPAATRNIDKLERMGLVVRTASKGDRRATLLSVSPQGRKLVSDYEEVKASRLHPVGEGFPREEIEQFSRLLERLSVALLKLDPSESKCCLRCAAYIETDCPVGRIHGGCPYDKLRGGRPPEVEVEGT